MPDLKECQPLRSRACIASREGSVDPYTRGIDTWDSVIYSTSKLEIFVLLGMRVVKEMMTSSVALAWSRTNAARYSSIDLDPQPGKSIQISILSSMAYKRPSPIIPLFSMCLDWN